MKAHKATNRAYIRQQFEQAIENVQWEISHYSEVINKDIDKFIITSQEIEKMSLQKMNDDK